MVVVHQPLDCAARLADDEVKFRQLGKMTQLTGPSRPLDLRLELDEGFEHPRGAVARRQHERREAVSSRRFPARRRRRLWCPGCVYARVRLPSCARRRCTWRAASPRRRAGTRAARCYRSCPRRWGQHPPPPTCRTSPVGWCRPQTAAAPGHSYTVGAAKKAPSARCCNSSGSARTSHRATSTRFCTTAMCRAFSPRYSPPS